MKEKFLSDVFKTARPWVLVILALFIIILLYLNQEETKNFLNSKFFQKIIFNLGNAFLFSIGLTLWDSKKFPINLKRIISLFFISLCAQNYLK